MKELIILFFVCFSFLSFGQDTLTIISDSITIDSAFIEPSSTQLTEINSDSVEQNTLTIASDSMVVDSAFVKITQKSLPPTRYVEIGISPISYKGELSSYDHWNMAFHAGLLLTRKKRINSEFSILGGQFSGQNRELSIKENTNPNTYFVSSFFSGSYHLHINLIAKPRFKFYVSQGIGIMNFTPKNANSENLIDIVETRAINEEYNTTTLFLPTQIGFHYALKNHFNLGAKVSWLNTRTDYLDNISEWGNPDNKDNILSYKIYVLIPIQNH